MKLGSQAVGELWICGDQVARGYLNRQSPEFVFNYMEIVEKAYRTGDLVRLLDNNQLEFLGRCDRQFKVNGVRVDPKEIVDIMRKVCNAQQIHISQINNQLVAFVVSEIKSEDVVKTSMMKHLPRYMIPTQIIELPGGFPLNQNGKVDQQKLKEICLMKSTQLLSPIKNAIITSELAQKLLSIWTQTIGHSIAIDLNSNFFEIGGHSLLILKLQAKIKEELKINLSFDKLYRLSNFSDQLTLIEEHSFDQHEVIQSIRECPNAKAAVYCIHPIGGTIYSYFSMSTIWPANCNIYAIAYKKNYPANTLEQLAGFYYKQVSFLALRQIYLK